MSRGKATSRDLLATVRHYRTLLSSALARCFPRTSAYLRDGRRGALFHQSAAPVAERSAVSITIPAQPCGSSAIR